MSTVVTYTTPGTYSGGSGWQCPAGVTSALVECWGGGATSGNGSAGTSTYTGGAGGEYANEPTLGVTAATYYTYVVAAHGGNSSTFAGDSVTVTAHGTTSATGGTGSTNTNHANGGAAGSG